jgi:hypothetical protein
MLKLYSIISHVSIISEFIIPIIKQYLYIDDCESIRFIKITDKIPEVIIIIISAVSACIAKRLKAPQIYL